MLQGTRKSREDWVVQVSGLSVWWVRHIQDEDKASSILGTQTGRQGQVADAFIHLSVFRRMRHGRIIHRTPV